MPAASRKARTSSASSSETWRRFRSSLAMRHSTAADPGHRAGTGDASAFLVDRAPQVGPGPRVVALVEEIAQVDPRAAEQCLQEAATVEPEQPRRHGAAVLGRDAAVVGIERGGFGTEDRHVAIEEVAGVVGDGAAAEIPRRK